MIKILVLYGPPESRGAFEEYYWKHFRPVARKCPHVLLIEPARILCTIGGDEGPYYRVDEMWFHGLDEALSCIDSPEGKAWRAEFPKFATGGVTVLLADTGPD